MRRIVSALAALGVAACSGPASLDVEDAWVRLPAVPGRPAAAYFTVRGGAQPQSLIRVTADFAVRAEMHETMSGGGHMSMRSIAAVPIPAGQEVAFEPGGKHVMLFDLDRRAKPGSTTLLTLTFSNGQRLYRKAWFVGAGQEGPE